MWFHPASWSFTLEDARLPRGSVSRWGRSMADSRATTRRLRRHHVRGLLATLLLVAIAGCSTAPSADSGGGSSSSSPSPRSSSELLEECRTAASSSGGGALTYDVTATLVGKPVVVCIEGPSGSGPTLKEVPADWSDVEGFAVAMSTDRPLPSNCEVGEPPTVLVYVGDHFLEARNPTCSGH